MPCRRIAVDQSLSRGTIEQLDGGKTLFRGTAGRALEGSAERGALSAITNRGGAGFPHVFLG